MYLFLDAIYEPLRRQGLRVPLTVTTDGAPGLLRAVLGRFGREYPSAMAGFPDDLEASLAHLEAPLAHRKYIVRAAQV